MIKTLYANGCSFTAGSELEQESPSLTRDSDRKDFHAISEMRRFQRAHAWPARLAKLLGVSEVVNEARGGGSNARAMRMTIDFVANYLAAGCDPALLVVCIGLTDLARSERFPSTGLAGNTEWEFLKPKLSLRSQIIVTSASRRANRLYYSYVYSETQAVSSYALQLIGLSFTLASLRIELQFHEAMEDNRTALLRNPEVARPLGLMNPKIHLSMLADGTSGPDFEPFGSFEAWTASRQLPLGVGGHPLSAGHDEWAKVLYKNLCDRGVVT